MCSKVSYITLSLVLTLKTMGLSKFFESSADVHFRKVTDDSRQKETSGRRAEPLGPEGTPLQLGSQGEVGSKHGAVTKTGFREHTDWEPSGYVVKVSHLPLFVGTLLRPIS